MSSKEKKSKKKNPFVSFLKGILIFFLSLILVLAIWLCFSAFDRTKAIRSVPDGFSGVAHTDNVYKAFNPLLDLKAVDVYLSSEPSFASFLPVLYTIRQSPLRKNPFVALLLSREMEAAFYTGGNFTSEQAKTGGGEAGGAGDAGIAGEVATQGAAGAPSSQATSENQTEEAVAPADYLAVVDLSWLSGFTRPLKFIVPLLKNEAFVMNQLDDIYYFTFKNEGANFYLGVKKNLVLFSQTKSLIETSLRSTFGDSAFTGKVETLSKKDSNPLKVMINARKLLSDMSKDNPEQEFYPIMEHLVSPSELSVLTFDIKDSSLSVSAFLPTDTSIEDPSYAKLMELFKTEVSVPAVLSRLSSSVQYYTVLNAAPLKSLKDAFFPILPDGKKYDSLWKNANDVTKSLLNNTLDDLVFSWTGKEFCVFGLEGFAQPVFALKISDEAKRLDVFDKLSSSFVVKDDTSLILNGVRLPRLVFPDYIQNLLKAFGKSMKGVYYMVSNGFIYFSESPEPLSSVFNSSSQDRISKNMNWKSVSEGDNASLLSLFYDLERSIPFFLKQKSQVSDILSMYSIGRFDIRLSDGVFDLSLNASGKRFSSRSDIPGFPVALSGEVSGNLLSSNGKDKVLYWVENEKIVKSFSIKSGKTDKFEVSGDCWVSPSLHSKANGVWVLTKDGEVFLLDENLSVQPSFPVYLDYHPSAEPASSSEGLVIPLSNGNLCYVSPDGSIEEVILNLTGQIKSKPFVSGKTVLVYEKGFIGKIHKIEGKNVSSDEPLSVSGVSYGSPVMFKKGKNEYISMITQSGNLYIWENGKVKQNFPIKLPGVFFSNVVWNGNYLYAISDTAQVFRISDDGTFLTVVIPSASSKEGFLSVAQLEKGNGLDIFASLDGNVLYGFNENLELLPQFPVPGWKNPVLTDVNGDGKTDVICLTADDKLAAWNVH